MDLSKDKQRLFLYATLTFVTEVVRIYCAVRVESLNTITHHMHPAKHVAALHTTTF